MGFHGVGRLRAFAPSPVRSVTTENRVVSRRSVTAEKRGAVASSGLRPERSKSGEARRSRTAFAESEGLEPRREQAQRDN